MRCLLTALHAAVVQTTAAAGSGNAGSSRTSGEPARNSEPPREPPADPPAGAASPPQCPHCGTACAGVGENLKRRQPSGDPSGSNSDSPAHTKAARMSEDAGLRRRRSSGAARAGATGDSGVSICDFYLVTTGKPCTHVTYARLRKALAGTPLADPWEPQAAAAIKMEDHWGDGDGCNGGNAVNRLGTYRLAVSSIKNGKVRSRCFGTHRTPAAVPADNSGCAGQGYRCHRAAMVIARPPRARRSNTAPEQQ